MERYPHLDAVPPWWWDYFAGLFTGEGCILIRDSLTASISIEMCDRGVVMDVHNRLGGHFSMLPIRRNVKQKQRPYKWDVTEAGLIFRIMRAVRPRVVGKKGRQIEAFMRFLLLKTSLQQYRHSHRRHRYTPAEKLKLVRVARIVKNYSGGNQKGWKVRWDAFAHRLEEEVGYAEVQELAKVSRGAASEV